MKKLTIWRFDYMATDDRAEEPYHDSFIGTIYEFADFMTEQANLWGYWYETKPKRRHATKAEIEWKEWAYK